MKHPRKDAFLILRLSQELKDLLLQEAENKGKSLSKYVRGIIEKRKK